MSWSTQPPHGSPETGTTLESLIVVLERGAVPFCNYANPHFDAPKPRWMPLAVLEAAQRLAADKGLRLIYLMGRHPLPRRHGLAVGRGSHVSIVPWALHRTMGDAIPVLNAREAAALGRSRGLPIENAILRLGRKDMPRLGSIFSRLAGRVKRLNVSLFDVGAYGEKDLSVYQEQLNILVQAVAGMNWPTGGTECNLVTDRLMLGAMNNCDAGVKHLTVAPNGRLYLCPGFYYRDEADAVGSLSDGIHVGNAHLLTLDYAPICRQCDAYQCRRCLLLNKQLTDEINTPSRQQCVAAHHEREASRGLLEDLRYAGKLNEATAGRQIAKLDYLDPFEFVQRRRLARDGRLPGVPGVPQPQGAAMDGGTPQANTGELRDLLMELRINQQEILNELRRIRQERDLEER